MTEYERGFIDGVKSKVSAELTPTLIEASRTMLEMLKPVLSTALENAIDLKAADVQPVDRWISVKDSVPEAGVNVLVTDGIHMMVTWCEYVDNQCLWVDNYYEYVNVRFKEVTHWMPLPEPPKDGEQND